MHADFNRTFPFFQDTFVSLVNQHVFRKKKYAQFPVCMAALQLGKAVELDMLKPICLETMWTCSNLTERPCRAFTLRYDYICMHLSGIEE